MRLANVFDRQYSFRLVMFLVLALVFFVVVGVPARTLGSFYGHLDALNENLRSGDYAAAKVEMDEVTSFYDRSRMWGMQWFADAYLLTDAFLQRAAYAYLTGDFASVIDALEGRVDDPRAAFLLGNAKFRIAQQRYRAIEGDSPKDLADKSAIIQEVVDLIAPDFERALRADTTDRFDFKWNYDLATDPEAVRRALELPKAGEPPELEQMKGEGTPVRRRRG